MPIYTLTQNPSKIPNLTLWLDSSDRNTLVLTQSGSLTASVISIKDKISGQNLVANNQLPTYYYNNINNNSTIYFDGLAGTGGVKTLSNMTMSFSLTHSIYIVAIQGASQSSVYGRYLLSIRRRVRSLTGYPDIQLSQYNSGTFSVSYYLESSTTTYNLFGGNYSNTLTLGASGSVNLNPVIVSAKAYGSSAIVKSKIYNSNSQKNFFTQSFGGGGTYSQIVLGDNLNIPYALTSISGQPALNSYFCEMLFYSRVLTDEENNKVVEYLKYKWSAQ